jgi:hypothetical protein
MPHVGLTSFNGASGESYEAKIYALGSTFEHVGAMGVGEAG